MFQSVLVKFLQFGKTFIKTIIQIGRASDTEATGKTFRSLSQAVKVNSSTRIVTEVTGSKVFDYIESGRPAGAKMPPEGALLEWMAVRGIPADKEWGVRRNIAKFGIKPFPLIELSFKVVQKEFESKLGAETSATIAGEVRQEILKNFQFPNKIKIV